MKLLQDRRAPLAVLACAVLALAAPQLGAAPAARSKTTTSSSTGSAGGMVTSQNPQALLAAVRSVDPQAQLQNPSDGGPYIASSYNDMKYLILLMNCDDAEQNCKTVQFYMGFSDAKQTSLEQLNEWNKTKRFARAYRDNDSDPVLEMDLDLDFKGIPRQNFLESIATWKTLMDAYRAHLFN